MAVTTAGSTNERVLGSVPFRLPKWQAEKVDHVYDPSLNSARPLQWAGAAGNTGEECMYAIVVPAPVYSWGGGGASRKYA